MSISDRITLKPKVLLKCCRGDYSLTVGQFYRCLDVQHTILDITVKILDDLGCERWFLADQFEVVDETRV